MSELLEIRVRGTLLDVDGVGTVLIESAEEGTAGSRDELVLMAEGPGSTRVVLTKRGAPLPWIAAYGVGTQIHLENLAAHLAGRGPIDPDPYWAELLPRFEVLAGEL